MQSNAIRVQVFFYHVDVEKCYFVYQNPVEIVLSRPHYIIKPLCRVGDEKRRQIQNQEVFQECDARVYSLINESSTFEPY